MEGADNIVNFAKVLDEVIPGEDDEEDEGGITTDREYWEEKASKESLAGHALYPRTPETYAITPPLAGTPRVTGSAYGPVVHIRTGVSRRPANNFGHANSLVPIEIAKDSTRPGWAGVRVVEVLDESQLAARRARSWSIPAVLGPTDGVRSLVCNKSSSTSATSRYFSHAVAGADSR